jgi:hypothetical protein
MVSITVEEIPVRRRAQPRDRFSIIGVVATENTTPPIPEPAEAMPWARERFFDYDDISMVGDDVKGSI